MSTTDDGGKAFPRPSVEITENERDYGQAGMSLRDWFAGMALQGILASEDYERGRGVVNPDNEDISVYAKLAYCYADAMLVEREQESPGKGS